MVAFTLLRRHASVVCTSTLAIITQCNAATVVHEPTRWNMMHGYALTLCRRPVTCQKVRSVFTRGRVYPRHVCIVLLKVVYTRMWKLNSKVPLPRGLLTEPGPRILPTRG